MHPIFCHHLGCLLHQLTEREPVLQIRCLIFFSIWCEGLGWVAHECQNVLASSKLSGSGKNWALAPHTSLKKDWLQSKDVAHSFNTTSQTSGSAVCWKLQNALITFPNFGCPAFSKLLTSLSSLKCCKTFSNNREAISGPSPTKDPNSEAKHCCHSSNDLPWMFVLTIRSIMDSVAAALFWHKLVAAHMLVILSFLLVQGKFWCLSADDWKLCF